MDQEDDGFDIHEDDGCGPQPRHDLRERGLGDVLERFPGRIRQQVEVQPHGQDRSVDNIGRIDTPSGRARQAGDKSRSIHNPVQRPQFHPQAVENVDDFLES